MRVAETAAPETLEEVQTQRKNEKNCASRVCEEGMSSSSKLFDVNNGTRRLDLRTTDITGEGVLLDLLRFNRIANFGKSTKSAKKCDSVRSKGRDVLSKQVCKDGHLPVYILKDDGASENFVSRRLVLLAKKRGTLLEERTEGQMIVLTAAKEEPVKEERRRIRLEISIGNCYSYNAWFTVYDMPTYDIVFGKRWSKDHYGRHAIDHATNILRIWETAEEMQDNTDAGTALVGLRQWQGLGRREAMKRRAGELGLELCFLDELFRGRSREQQLEILECSQVVTIKVADGVLDNTLCRPGDLDQWGGK